MCTAREFFRLLSALPASVALATAGAVFPAFADGLTTTPPPVISPASKAPPGPRPQDLLLACPTTRDYVGRVVAAVMVNGKGPFRFIIDTGANNSMVSAELASALGLATSGNRLLQVAGVTGTALVPSVPIDSMRAGALSIVHSEVPVISSPIMTGADGILGAAALAEDSLLVDFRHNTVTIRASGNGAIPLGYARVRARRLRSGLLSAPGTVGDVAVDAIIDTGSPQTLGNMALYRALYGKPDTRDRASVYGVTKQVRAGNVEIVPTLDLGAIRIGNAVLVFGDLPIFKVWGLTAHPAIILGMDVLGTVDAFSIDFDHAQIGIAPRDYDVAQPIPPSG